MTQFPAFLKWGKYTSNDEKNPDELIIRIRDVDTFETQYSVNVNADVEYDGVFEKRTIPLKSHDSVNASLLNLWITNSKSKIFKENKKIRLLTWLGISKNDRPIRRWRLA